MNIYILSKVWWRLKIITEGGEWMACWTWLVLRVGLHDQVHLPHGRGQVPVLLPLDDVLHVRQDQRRHVPRGPGIRRARSTGRVNKFSLKEKARRKPPVAEKEYLTNAMALMVGIGESV